MAASVLDTQHSRRRSCDYSPEGFTLSERKQHAASSCHPRSLDRDYYRFPELPAGGWDCPHREYGSHYQAPPRPAHSEYYSYSRSRQPSPVGGQERYYRGSAPTIPYFVHPNPQEFARLRIALEKNILPADATEQFKFQILVDRLKLEEALLIADSYSHSRHTMDALNQE